LARDTEYLFEWLMLFWSFNTARLDDLLTIRGSFRTMGPGRRRLWDRARRSLQTVFIAPSEVAEAQQTHLGPPLLAEVETQWSHSPSEMQL
jgi:hypothetical protein